MMIISWSFRSRPFCGHLEDVDSSEDSAYILKFSPGQELPDIGDVDLAGPAAPLHQPVVLQALLGAHSLLWSSPQQSGDEVLTDPGLSLGL